MPTDNPIKEFLEKAEKDIKISTRTVPKSIRFDRFIWNIAKDKSFLEFVGYKSISAYTRDAIKEKVVKDVIEWQEKKKANNLGENSEIE